MKFINFYNNLDLQTGHKLSFFVEMILVPSILSLVITFGFDSIFFLTSIIDNSWTIYIVALIVNYIIVVGLFLLCAIVYIIISSEILDFKLSKTSFLNFKRMIKKASQEELIESKVNLTPE